MSHATPAASAPAESVARSHVPLGAILAIACVANFMVIIDTSIVNVALPAMKAALGLSPAQQQWVVDAYLITFGGFLLLAARAGDLFGRKVVFQAGLVVFTVASLAGGVAWSPGMLIGARVIQGVGAAVLGTSSLSLLTASHPEGPSRTHALSLWAAVGASAGAVGLVLGGVLTATLSWRYVLFVNVPIGIALLMAGSACLMPSPPRCDRERLDLPGALAVTVGIGALVYGVSQASIKGWGSAPVIAALAAAAVLVAAFGIVEARSEAPLVPLGIFRQRSLTVGNAVMAGLGMVMTAGLFFLSLYLQQLVGYSALRTGVAMVPTSVMLAARTARGQTASTTLWRSLAHPHRRDPRDGRLGLGVPAPGPPQLRDSDPRPPGPHRRRHWADDAPAGRVRDLRYRTPVRRIGLRPVQHGAPARRRHGACRTRHHRRHRQPSQSPRGACGDGPRLPHRTARQRGRQPGLGSHCPAHAEGSQTPCNPHSDASASGRYALIPPRPHRDPGGP